MALEDEENPYELLEINIDSTEQEIRTAYRQRSLKVHPDKVRRFLSSSPLTDDSGFQRTETNLMPVAIFHPPSFQLASDRGPCISSQVP
jgi:DnaJ domain